MVIRRYVMEGIRGRDEIELEREINGKGLIR
jgi:hypothetical protein